jgi:hypothetical protein
VFTEDEIVLTLHDEGNQGRLFKMQDGNDITPWYPTFAGADNKSHAVKATSGIVLRIRST